MSSCEEQTDDFSSETAMICMLKLSRFLRVLRLVYPRKVHREFTVLLMKIDVLGLAASSMELV